MLLLPFIIPTHKTKLRIMAAVKPEPKSPLKRFLMKTKLSTSLLLSRTPSADVRRTVQTAQVR